MSDELKPCPFCGRHDGKFYDFDLMNGSHEFVVECLNDDCAGRTGVEDTASEAVAAWNRRTDIETGEDYDASFAELMEAWNLSERIADGLRAENEALKAQWEAGRR